MACLTEPTIVASNFWFGTRHAARQTQGTRTLASIFRRHAAVEELFVETNRTARIEHGIDNYGAYRDALAALRTSLERSACSRVVNLGGGCAAAIAIVPYLAERHPGLRVLWIDAHADLNTPDSSTSHYIHGMTLGILTSYRTLELFSGAAPALDPRQILLCAQKELDPYELDAVGTLGIRTTEPGRAAAELSSSRDRSAPPTPVYVHLDFDALHPDVLPNPKCNVRSGFDIETLAQMIADIASETHVVGFSLAENFETDTSRLEPIAAPFLRLLV